MNMKDERELIDTNLLKATIRLNALLFALSGFIFGGLGLMLVTLFAKPYPDHMLNILSFFLPGYEVSSSGAWFGLIWGGAIGAIGSVWCYKIYSRNITSYVMDFMNSGKKINELEKMHLPMHGKTLGLILGGLASISLFSTSMYLTSIGHTAGKHIDILSKWLPHYELSLIGAMLGSVELFLIVFLFWNVVSFIYNKIVQIRSGATS